MKRIIKWLLILLLVALALLAVALLSLDHFLRVVTEKRILEQTGMVAEIGEFHFGLLEPVVSVKDFKLHNPPGFGDAPFLVIPEVRVEYDKPALRQGRIHLTLVRFNFGELDIVKNAAGQTNLLALGMKLPGKPEEKKADALAELKKRTNMNFEGVDELVVSVGRAKFIDLKNPANNRQQEFDIENQTFKHVTSPADLSGLIYLLSVRSDGFFSDIFGAKDNWSLWPF